MWRAGKIIGHDFLDEDEQTWVYVVKLQQGYTVYAPNDCDECIRQWFRYTFTSVYDDEDVQQWLRVRFDIGTHVVCRKLVHIPVDNNSFVRLAMKYYFSPEHMPDGPEHAVRVRFEIGTCVLIRTVNCNVKWEKGRVLAYNWQEQSVPGFFHPYQVRLDNGELFYSLIDDDEQIRCDY